MNANRPFKMLWIGQSLNIFGDALMLIALPLLAVQVIGVSDSQAALLPFALGIPFCLFGLPAGVIADQLPRRLTMIVCSTIQAVIFMIVTILAFSSTLTFPILMLLVSIAGTAVVFFQITYTSYVPELFSKAGNLQQANSRLFFSESMAKTFGSMLGGQFIAWLGLVGAIAVNAMTFMFSVLSLLAIKHKPLAVKKPKKKLHLRLMYREIGEGLHFVFRHQRLEPVITCGVVYVIFCSMLDSSLVLYCRKILGLSSVSIGFVMGTAATGFPLGNLLCTKLVRNYGFARTLFISASVSVLGLIFIPLAGSLGSVTGLIAAHMLHGVGEGVFGPAALTLRQTETPDQLLGRMNSVQRFLMWGATPIGSLFAALTITFFGLSSALWVGGFGTIFCLPVLTRKGIIKELLNPRDFISSSK